MNFIKVRIIYISGAEGMKEDHGHEVFLPAVPRAGDFCYLLTAEGGQRQFQVSGVAWHPMSEEDRTLVAWGVPARRARVEIQLVAWPGSM